MLTWPAPHFPFFFQHYLLVMGCSWEALKSSTIAFLLKLVNTHCMSHHCESVCVDPTWYCHMGCFCISADSSFITNHAIHTRISAGYALDLHHSYAMWQVTQQHPCDPGEESRTTLCPVPQGHLQQPQSARATFLSSGSQHLKCQVPMDLLDKVSCDYHCMSHHDCNLICVASCDNIIWLQCQLLADSALNACLEQ